MLNREVQNIKKTFQRDVELGSTQRDLTERRLRETEIRIGELKAQLYSLDQDKKLLQSGLRVEQLHKHLIPKIGKKVSISGQLAHLKVGWVLFVEGTYIYVGIHPKAEPWRFPYPDRYSGRKVVVTGILSFGVERGPNGPALNLSEDFFLDPNESLIEDQKTPNQAPQPTTGPAPGRG